MELPCVLNCDARANNLPGGCNAGLYTVCTFLFCSTTSKDQGMTRIQPSRLCGAQ